ncbi:hypothetical protein FSC02_10545 [Acinetobacter indicus]|uniref:hypothetical protein n=1 Tax=Acinetobacter indicus TaxID=756892 RepID=UPI0013B09163|nr:hypothetical protein [Acinetobacter indicus]QIC79530.1 hypothetical protein FSC02_10545 [Acinetobacter indicus]
MKKLILLAGLCVAFGAEAKQSSKSIEAIKQKIIQQSIENYPGNCSCPYNTASNGSRCGKRSADHRADDYSPLYYPEERGERMLKGDQTWF